MKMIIGGAWQGQLAWAKENCRGMEEGQWIDGKNCNMEEIYTCKGIYDFQEYIRRALKQEYIRRDLKQEEEHPEDGGKISCGHLAGEIIRRNPGAIIVSNEIGYGLVPVDDFERAYREQVGRTCTELAEFSDVVVRVVMGIGNYIKGTCEREIGHGDSVGKGTSSGN